MKLKDISNQMKEKLKNRIKSIFRFIVRVSIIIITLIYIVVLIYSTYNSFNMDVLNFFTTDLSNIGTIIIAIFFAYYFVEQKNDIRKQKEVIESDVKKLKELLYDDEIYTINLRKSRNSLKRRIKIKKIINFFAFLKIYENKFGYKDDMKEVEKKFKEYRLLSEFMIQNNVYSEKNSSKLLMYIEIIDDKLEKIIHRIYS